MKNRIHSLVVALFVLAISTVAVAKPNSGTINIQNNTVHNLGNVQVMLNGAPPVYQYIPGFGTFPVTVNYGPTAVVINNYVTQIGQIGTAVTTDGHTIKVDFSQGSSIVVTDQQQVN